MQWSIGNKIAASFGVALTVLIVVGSVSYDSTSRLIDSAGWVAHTHQVLNGFDQVLGLLKDAETGQRGFIVTGEERYLEPYNSAREALNRKLTEVRTLTADNPAQQQRLSALDA